MKKTMYLYAVAVVALAGCGPRGLVVGALLQETTKKEAAAAKKADEFLRDFRATSICNQTEGEVAVEGVTIGMIDNKMVLDRRVEVVRNRKHNAKPTQDTTVNEDPLLKLVSPGSAGFMGERDKKLLQELSLNKQGTYINLGCQDIKQELIAGLQERKFSFSTGEVLTSTKTELNATKLFVCNGEPSIFKGSLSIFASETYLNNAQFVQLSENGELALITDKLVIEGNNRIEMTSPMRKIKQLEQAPRIKLYVGKETHGSGKLYLDSSADNCTYEKLVSSGKKTTQVQSR